MLILGFSDMYDVRSSLQYRTMKARKHPVPPSGLKCLHNLVKICSSVENNYPPILISVSQLWNVTHSEI